MTVGVQNCPSVRPKLSKIIRPFVQNCPCVRSKWSGTVLLCESRYSNYVYAGDFKCDICAGECLVTKTTEKVRGFGTIHVENCPSVRPKLSECATAVRPNLAVMSRSCANVGDITSDIQTSSFL